MFDFLWFIWKKERSLGMVWWILAVLQACFLGSGGHLSLLYLVLKYWYWRCSQGVWLLNLPSNHIQELKKKKKSSGVLKMTALLSSKKPFPKLPRICNLSLSFFRREKVKRKSILIDTWDVKSSLEVSERLQLGNLLNFSNIRLNFEKSSLPKHWHSFLKSTNYLSAKKLFPPLRWQGISALGRSSLVILKCQIFLLLQEAFTSF